MRPRSQHAAEIMGDHAHKDPGVYVTLKDGRTLKRKKEGADATARESWLKVAWHEGESRFMEFIPLQSVYRVEVVTRKGYQAEDP